MTMKSESSLATPQQSQFQNVIEAQQHQTSSTDKLVPQVQNTQQPYKMKQQSQENYKLRKNNEMLKTQLQNINQRLDQELGKRSGKMQQKSEKLINMELRNAYKRCQILKKQIISLKKKDVSESKQDSYSYQIIQKDKQVQELRNQIKGLKKINKFQQKGLIELGVKDYASYANQNDRIRVQNRKLLSKLEENERSIRSNNISIKKQRNHPSSNLRAIQRQSQHSNQKIEREAIGLKTAQERDSQKVKQLVFENNRQQQLIENLKMQLADRDKEMQHLKETIANLRRIMSNRHKVSNRNHIKMHTQSTLVNVSLPVSVQERIYREQIRNKNGKKKVHSQSNPINDSPPTYSNQNIYKYPRMEERGQKNQLSFKWNHHSFSSKIKQLLIMPHKNGHIKAIHVRYQKGQPSKVHGQYSSFICQEFNQYIRSISGGFKYGLLQFLVVATNQKRVNKFCRYDLEDQCIKFSFNILDNQYPCALFGENIEEGVVRLGCFIQKVDEAN